MDGVFGKRLQTERRHVESKRSGIDLQIDFEAVFVAKLLEGDVMAEKFVFGGKFDEVAALLFQGVAEHVAEPLDGVFGNFRAEFYQRGKSVKRVEQKMRIKTSAYGVEARRGCERFRTRGEILLFVETIASLHGVRDAGKEAIKPNAHEKLPAEKGRTPETAEAIGPGR